MAKLLKNVCPNCTYLYIHTHTHTHTHIYIYIYIQKKTRKEVKKLYLSWSTDALK